MLTSSSSLRYARQAAVLLCTLFVSAASASAQSAEPAASSGYWQAINRGVAEYGVGQFERAGASFELAQRLWPNARPLRGLGKVAFAQHHFVAAIDYFQQALASNVHPLDAAMKREAEELLVHARSALAEVQIEVQPPQAELTIDDQPASAGVDKSLRLDPGDHQILARAQGFVSERRDFTLQPGQRTSWSFHLQPHIAADAPPTPREAASTLPLPAATEPPRDSRPRWLLPVGGTLAVAGLATAGAALAFSVSHFDDSAKVLTANDAPSRARYLDRWQASRSRMYLWSGVATGFLTLGAGALADYIPREQRYWLTPTLAAAGGVLLITGLSLYGANRGLAAGTGGPEQRLSPSDRADTGTLLTLLSAPLLTIPLMHAVAWLSGNQ